MQIWLEKGPEGSTGRELGVEAETSRKGVIICVPARTDAQSRLGAMPAGPQRAGTVQLNKRKRCEAQCEMMHGAQWAKVIRRV
eukprot:scaffold200584_cov18-Tisochrysis_lutea.AAC.1